MPPSPWPWIDVFAISEKCNMAVTKSGIDPTVREMSITSMSGISVCSLLQHRGAGMYHTYKLSEYFCQNDKSMKAQTNIKCTKRNYKCGKNTQRIMKGEENPNKDPKKRPLSSSSNESTPVVKMPNTQQSPERDQDPCTPGEEISMANLYHILTDMKNSQKQMKQDIQNEIKKLKRN